MPKELITEVVSASIFKNSPIPTTTDEVVSQYENWLSQNVASKSLAASQAGQPPVFTKEETAYLNKKASEIPCTEINVITPEPIINLKKGNTEINIKNAATLVKKMEEMYPTPNKTIEIDEDENAAMVDEVIRELEEEVEQEKKEETVERDMKDRFRKLVNFPSKNVSPEIAKAVAPDETIFQSQFPPHGGIKTTNKNAYEIRESIIERSIDILKSSTDGEELNADQSADKVLQIAAKLYKFVENKK